LATAVVARWAVESVLYHRDESPSAVSDLRD
jgi:hypothetical protein